jgi:hypothetical protein
MDCGPSRRGHLGARDGLPPQVGCADRPHPRRFGAGRLELRLEGETSSSDRVSAVPVNTMTVWPEPALQLAGNAGATSRQGQPPPGGASGSPCERILRDSRRWVPTQHPPLRTGMRASGAQTSTPSGVRACGERSHHQVRGQPRKVGEHELEPPVAALRSERWVANESLRRCVAMTSDPCAFGRSDRRGGTSSRGRIHWHSTVSFGARRGVRPRCLLREMPEPRRPAAVLPSGKLAARVAGARQGRNTLPSLDVRVAGRQSGSGRQAKRPAHTLGGAKRAAASERVDPKAQGSIERARLGNVARVATDSSVEESLEVGEQGSRAWRHASEHGSERREGTPAGERDPVRKDETR